MDDLVVDFLESIEDTVGDDILVVFTSDHGEEFFERDLLAHGHSLYGELLHVPLVIRAPGPPAPGTSDQPASVIDLVPTVLDVVGLPVPAHLPGHSLLATVPGDRDRVGRFSGRAHALEHDGWKIIRGRVNTPRGPLPDPQLFDLRADPGELVDLSGQHPAKLAEMSARLDAYLERWDAPAAVMEAADPNADALSALQELGYLEH